MRSDILIKLCLILTIIFNFANLSTGISCYECGKLSLLPVPSSNQCGGDQSYLKESETCYKTLSGTSPTVVPLNNIEWKNSSKKSTFQVREVCYILKGEFRGDELVMKGCDAVDIEWSKQQDLYVNYTTKCFDNQELSAWFNTEKGRENITISTFCFCDGDYCNEEKRGSGHTPGINNLFLGLLLLKTLIGLKVMFD